MRRDVYGYVFLVAGVATMALAACLVVFPVLPAEGIGIEAGLFFLFTAAAAYLPVQVTEKTDLDTCSAPLLAAVLTLPPGLAVLIACLSGWFPRRGRPYRVIDALASAGQSSLAVAAAALVYTRMYGGPASMQSPRFWAATAAACLVFYLSNALLVSGLASLRASRNWPALFLEMVRLRTLEYVVLYCLGLVSAVLVRLFPAGVALLLVPVTLALVFLDRQQKVRRALARTNQDLLLAYDQTLSGWARSLELREQETKGHADRVMLLTLDLACRMSVPDCQLTHIRRGALLHDIGKTGIPDSILNKPGPLTEEEWSQMRKHPLFAHDLLRPVSYLAPSLDIPFAHHEHWDGSGYPCGLKGEQIPLPARIFAVVDAWDALCYERSYRPAWSPREICLYIRSQSGARFDPAVVQAFNGYIKDHPELVGESMTESRQS